MLLWALMAIGCKMQNAADADTGFIVPMANISPTALPPAGWTDNEALAYTREVSRALAGDAATIEKRVRSAALRTFARRVAFQHKQIAARADSMLRYNPEISMEQVGTVQRHKEGIDRLQRQRDFDLKYVKLVRQTLRDAQRRFEAARSTARPPAISALLEQAETAVRAEAANAKRIEDALLERRSAPSTQSR